MNIQKESKMKKLFCIAAVLILLGFAISCKKTENTSVIIYTSTEDFRTEHMQKLLKEKFPNYNITLQVLSTGNHAAKLKAEGTKTISGPILLVYSIVHIKDRGHPSFCFFSTCQFGNP